MSTATDAPIAVIGAGVAGLTAAVRLAEAGLPVLVLEARGRLGGRATSFEDKETGALVDNGQHVMFGCYHETLGLLRTIGAEANIRIQPTLDVSYVDLRGRKTRLRCADLPSPLHLLGGLIEWEALRWRDRWAARRVWRAVQSSRRSASRVPDALSVREWLVGLGQTRRLRDFLWEPLAIAALNEPPEIASAREYANVLALMFSGGPANAAIVMPTVPLDRMYAEPARKYIESRGGAVRVNALARIVPGDAGLTGIRVGSQTMPARAVICAVPWNAFSPVFDPMPAALRPVADAAARMLSRPIVTANLWYDRLVVDEDFVGFPNATIQWVFEKGRTSSHLSCIVSGAIELVDRSNDDIIAIARADVESRLPRARQAVFVRGAVVRERHATFSVPRATGTATDEGGVARPSTTTDVPGLFLAGDWIETGLPGTIEGAARSGTLAAQAVLAEVRGKVPVAP